MEKSICCEEFVTIYHDVNITGVAFENLNLAKIANTQNIVCGVKICKI